MTDRVRESNVNLSSNYGDLALYVLGLVSARRRNVFYQYACGLLRYKQKELHFSLPTKLQYKKLFYTVY